MMTRRKRWECRVQNSSSSLEEEGKISNFDTPQNIRQREVEGCGVRYKSRDDETALDRAQEWIGSCLCSPLHDDYIAQSTLADTL